MKKTLFVIMTAFILFSSQSFAAPTAGIPDGNTGFLHQPHLYDPPDAYFYFDASLSTNSDGLTSAEQIAAGLQDNLRYAWTYSYEGINGLEESVTGDIDLDADVVGQSATEIGLTGAWIVTLRVSELSRVDYITEIGYDEIRWLEYAIFKDLGLENFAIVCFISTVQKNNFSRALGYILRPEFIERTKNEIRQIIKK